MIRYREYKNLIFKALFMQFNLVKLIYKFIINIVISSLHIYAYIYTVIIFYITIPLHMCKIK